MKFSFALIALLCLQQTAAKNLRVSEQSQVNPIRRVVTMLQSMQKKVAA